MPPLEKKLGLSTRDAYGKTLVELGRTNKRIVVLDADLSKSTKTEFFAKEFPERFYDFGIAEANMVGVASGLASCGKIPVISSFACFLMCKGYDQIRMSVAFPEQNVKLVSSHGGISVGEDGVSQQSIEDFGLACSFPGMVVLSPSDEHATRALLKQAIERTGPVYMRTGRPKAPLVHTAETKFELGKGILLHEGKDAAIVATGLLVFEALVARENLAKRGIQVAVADIHTIKPLDRALVAEVARKTGAVVTAEEHQIYGGLGSAVSRALSETQPVPMEFIALQDTYAESGQPAELFDRYGLSAAHIEKAVLKVLEKKKSHAR